MNSWASPGKEFLKEFPQKLLHESRKEFSKELSKNSCRISRRNSWKNPRRNYWRNAGRNSLEALSWSSSNSLIASSTSFYRGCQQYSSDLFFLLEILLGIAKEFLPKMILNTSFHWKMEFFPQFLQEFMSLDCLCSSWSVSRQPQLHDS